MPEVRGHQKLRYHPYYSGADSPAPSTIPDPQNNCGFRQTTQKKGVEEQILNVCEMATFLIKGRGICFVCSFSIFPFFDQSL
jgi:hypothetical protein